MKLQTIPQDLIFDLPQVNGAWYSAFQTSCLYLMAPDELFKIFKKDKKEYQQILEPIILLLRDAAEKIKEDGLLVEQDFDPKSISKSPNPPDSQPLDSGN